MIQPPPSSSSYLFSSHKQQPPSPSYMPHTKLFTHLLTLALEGVLLNDQDSGTDSQKGHSDTRNDGDSLIVLRHGFEECFICSINMCMYVCVDVRGEKGGPYNNKWKGGRVSLSLRLIKEGTMRVCICFVTCSCSVGSQAQ